MTVNDKSGTLEAFKGIIRRIVGIKFNEISFDSHQDKQQVLDDQGFLPLYINIFERFALLSLMVLRLLLMLGVSGPKVVQEVLRLFNFDFVFVKIGRVRVVICFVVVSRSTLSAGLPRRQEG